MLIYAKTLWLLHPHTTDNRTTYRQKIGSVRFVKYFLGTKNKLNYSTHYDISVEKRLESCNNTFRKETHMGVKKLWTLNTETTT